MNRIHPARWLSKQAVTGFKDLPRNGAWLLSKVLIAPSSMSGVVTSGISDEMRRTAIAVADAIPGTGEPVELRLKRAETAITRAKAAEQAALADAKNASVLADRARALDQERRERMRRAEREGRQEVDRRTQQARDRVAQVVERERTKASREVDAAIERLASDVGAEVDRAQAEAEAAAERARARIDQAHEQLAAARSLATEATEAAERVAGAAHEHARALVASAEREAGSADRFVDEARRTEASLANAAARGVRAEEQQTVPARLNELTKAELADLAESLGVTGASRMTKDELIKAVRRASRVKARG